jgi:hypothetical protein
MRVRYYRHARRDRSTVALTFDDGPNPPRTDQVLEILTSKDARATFFIIGKWAERTEDDAARLRRPIPTIRALPKVIDGLRARGLEPVGLDAMEFDQPDEWEPHEQG